MDERANARAAAAAGAGPDPVAATEVAAGEIGTALGDRQVTLAVVFLGAGYATAAEEVREVVARVLRPDVLVGVSAQGVVAGAAEIEHPASVSVWAAALPGATCTGVRYPAPEDGAGGAATWPDIPPDAKAVVLLADPFTFPAEAFLAWLHQHRPGLPVMGGLASGAMRAGGNRLLLDDGVYSDGAVAVALGGAVRVTPLVSQGCRPVGPSYAVTRGERNVIVELAGQPAAERVQQIYGDADESDRERMRSGLHIGLVIDEYAERHDTGNFLVRAVLGADPDRGAVAVGDLVHVGQTVRFHVRDAASADEELRQQLERLAAGPPPDGALLFTCNGRGTRLFGVPDHDASLVAEALGGAPLAGFFAAGEVGPVGGRNHLHGFTASLLTIAAADERT